MTSSGGAVRPKPDLTAADGVNTTVPGFQPFFGTSAAAPYAAAIAGLLLSAKPNATPAQIRQTLTGSAVDIGPAGFDTVAGGPEQTDLYAAGLSGLDPVPGVTIHRGIGDVLNPAMQGRTPYPRSTRVRRPSLHKNWG